MTAGQGETTEARSESDVAELRKRIDSLQWYQMIELAPGLVTPGWFDIRRITERLPWPDLRGKRCLDVGTSEGFWAFEMERRGAAEVVATDAFDAANMDWPVGTDVELIARTSAASARVPAFDLARSALGSTVERLQLTAYDP